MFGYVWLLVAMCGHEWLCVTVGSCVVIGSYVYLCVALCGYV